MRKLLALCCLLCGCMMHQPVSPGTVLGGDPHVSRDGMNTIAEVFGDAQGTITKDFPLPEPIIIDTISGTMSFYRLNRHCRNKDIATVGFLSSEGGALITWNLQDETNGPVFNYFPGGVSINSLHFEAYNDLCLPTDFRLALTFHRFKSKEE